MQETATGRRNMDGFEMVEAGKAAKKQLVVTKTESCIKSGMQTPNTEDQTAPVLSSPTKA